MIYPPNIERRATFSPCQTYRYTLNRFWFTGSGQLLFILLNPSTADATNDDPTNRRGIDFAFRWGYSGVTFCNLFAFRSPHPKVMKGHKDPIGPENDRVLMEEADEAALIVAAWGNHGSHRNRSHQVKAMMKKGGFDLHCLGTTKTNAPKHILYLPKDAEIETFACQ